MDAQPLQDAIVLNVGDLLQRWSNGISPAHRASSTRLRLTALLDTLKSSLHRVTLPPRQDRFTGDEKLTRARYSIPYFVGPVGNSRIGTVPSCTDEKHPSKYEPITWDDYRLMRGSMQYESKEALAA